MPIPTGATSVKYSARYYNGDSEHTGVPTIEIDLSLESQLPDYAPELSQLTDDALAAAFLAFAETVETTYPSVPGGVTRAYSGPIAGDTWPPAP